MGVCAPDGHPSDPWLQPAGPPLTAKLIEGPISARFFPGYGHVDIFMGQRADEDVFPVIVNELEKGAAS